LDLEEFQKIKKDHLKAFVVVRIQKDLRVPFKRMNKGTAGEARNGSINCLVYKPNNWQMSQ
jgi:hypothetical protein